MRNGQESLETRLVGNGNYEECLKTLLVMEGQKKMSRCFCLLFLVIVSLLLKFQAEEEDKMNHERKKLIAKYYFVWYKLKQSFFPFGMHKFS